MGAQLTHGVRRLDELDRECVRLTRWRFWRRPVPWYALLNRDWDDWCDKEGRTKDCVHWGKHRIQSQQCRARYLLIDSLCEKDSPRHRRQRHDQSWSVPSARNLSSIAANHTKHALYFADLGWSTNLSAVVLKWKLNRDKVRNWGRWRRLRRSQQRGDRIESRRCYTEVLDHLAAHPKSVHSQRHQLWDPICWKPCRQQESSADTR